MTQKTTENSYSFIHPRWFFKKLSLGFLSLIFLFLVACPLTDPVIEETFIATNVDVTIMVTTTEDSQVFINSNFVFFNQTNAVIYYTSNGFTNIFFSMTLLSNDERIVFLSNVTGSGNVTTTRIEITNIVTNNSNSYYLLMTNVVSNTEPVVNFTNYFTNVFLSTTSITNTNWASFDFSGANLSHLILSNYNLRQANLSFANLVNASLYNASLYNANLSNANLSNANLNFAVLNNVILNFANLSGANLNAVDLTGANLNTANLTGASLSGAGLIGASLINANLSNANLFFADLSNAVFTGTRTNGAILTSVMNADFTGAIP